MHYRLLTEFENLFRHRMYRHRSSTQGDIVAMQLYEDLFGLGRSSKLLAGVSSREVVLNGQNRRRGIQARRGDGTLGELVPGQRAVLDPGFGVSHGPVANVQIGTEVKILHKAMIKQIDRVIGDLQKQVGHFRRGGGQPICVGIIGVNHAPYTTSYEGDREYTTEGKTRRHPIQEAPEAIRRLLADVRSHYDELLILPYIAINEDPFAFSWVDYANLEADYAAALVRISREYDRRF